MPLLVNSASNGSLASFLSLQFLTDNLQFARRPIKLNFQNHIRGWGKYFDRKCFTQERKSKRLAKKT